jgi:hypothetical protein
MKTEPLRTIFLPLALAAFVAAAQAFLAGADTRGIIAAALGVLIVGAQELGRSLVSPVPAKAARAPRRRRRRAEAGYSIIEAILVVFLVAVCLIVIFHFA